MFSNMKMEMKVMWAMILMAAIVLMVGLVGILGMNQINESRDEIAKVALPGIIAPQIINEAKAAIKSGERVFSLLRWGLIGAIVLSILLAVVIGIRIRRNVAHSIEGLMDEAGKLVKAAIRGSLATRGDPHKVNFEFRDIVIGVNEILDGCIEATAQQGKAAQKVAAGDLSVQIQVRSEKDIIAISMNNVIASLNDLRSEMQRLTKASQEGMLSERGRPEKFRGAYAEIVQGVNEMLDAIHLPIGEGNRILRLIRGGNLREKVEIVCKGDHERMKDAINGVHAWLSELLAYVTKVAYGDLTATMPKASEEDQIDGRLVLMKDNIQALVADATMLAKAAVDGKFSTRADTAKHQGDFRKLVSSVNEILDAVIGPLNLAAEYVDRISKGEISPKISDNDKRDFDKIFWEMVAQNKPFFK